MYTDDTFIITGGYPEHHILGIKPDGEGNVTSSHIVWRSRRNTSYVPSPIAYRGLFFIVSDDGIASCYEPKTGKMLWGSPEITVHVHGQGMVGDIDPENPGMECYAGEAKGGSNYWLYSASGKRLSDQSLGELSPKAVYWLDGTNKVFIVGNTIYRWPRQKVWNIEGRIVAIADCLGDWREEVITSLKGEIRIYTTITPATSRRVCLLQDRLYRTDVAMQTMGYFYPPQLGGRPLPQAKDR